MAVPMDNLKNAGLRGDLTAFDDGRDWTSVLIARMRGVEKIATSPGGSVPKPTGEIVRKDIPVPQRNAKIGKRKGYSRTILICLYQLLRISVPDGVICIRAGIPQDELDKIKNTETELQKKVLNLVQSMDKDTIPPFDIVFNRLSTEAKINSKDKK